MNWGAGVYKGAEGMAKMLARRREPLLVHQKESRNNLSDQKRFILLRDVGLKEQIVVMVFR